MEIGGAPPHWSHCAPLNITHRHHPYRAYLPFPMLDAGDAAFQGSWTQLYLALPVSFGTGLWFWMGPRSPVIVQHLILFLIILAALAIPCPLVHPGSL